MTPEGLLALIGLPRHQPPAQLNDYTCVTSVAGMSELPGGQDEMHSEAKGACVHAHAHAPGVGRRKPLLPWPSLLATRVVNWEGGVLGDSCRHTTSTLRMGGTAYARRCRACTNPHTDGMCCV